MVGEVVVVEKVGVEVEVVVAVEVEAEEVVESLVLIPAHIQFRHTLG